MLPHTSPDFVFGPLLSFSGEVGSFKNSPSAKDLTTVPLVSKKKKTRAPCHSTAPMSPSVHCWVVHAPAFDKGCWYEESTGTARRLNCGVMDSLALGRPCDAGVAEFDFGDFTWRSDVRHLDLPTLGPKPLTKPGLVKRPTVGYKALDHAERKRIHSRG